MRLDWIFLLRENPCAKFYMIIIIIIILIIIIIIIIIMMIINCGLWDLLDVKSEAGLLLAIMPFRPQTYATRPQGLVDNSKSLNIWSLLHGIEPHKHLPLSFYDKKLGFITEFGIF